MQKYITGKEILKSYDIVEIELFDLVTSRGLQPIDDHGKPLPDPIVEIFDEILKELNMRLDAIKCYVPQRFVFTENQHREDRLKQTQEGIEYFKRLRQVRIDKNKQSGGSTWHRLRLRSDEESEALKQLRTLENATYLRGEVEKLLGKFAPSSEKVKVSQGSKESKWEYLGIKIKHELDILEEAGGLPKTPEECHDRILTNSVICRIISREICCTNKKIKTVKTSYIRKMLKENGVLDPRIRPRTGRNRKVLKEIPIRTYQNRSY